MSDPYYVLVAGNGESSRANIEALMDDYYYAAGESGTLVLSYESAPTKSQLFAAQFAKDKLKDILIFCPEGAQTSSSPAASLTNTDSPLEDAIEFLTGESASIFVLWSDEDEDSLALLKMAQKAKIPCFNLCDGLVPLQAIKGAGDPVAPRIPEAEKVTQEEDYEDEEEEDSDEAVEPEDILYSAVFDIAEVITDIIVERLKDVFVLKTDK